MSKKCFCALLILAANLAMAEDVPQPFKMPDAYSVEIAYSSNGEKRNSKYFFSNRSYRVETRYDDKDIITLFDAAKNRAYTVFPNQKAYLSTQMATDVSEPFAPPSNAQWRLIGKESVNGQMCEKYECKMTSKNDEKTILHYWIRETDKLPLRATVEDTTLEWSNFNVGAQSADLFLPPKDFKERIVPGELPDEKESKD
ncbi:MAG: DUF4412 domain-containing protein [bacterium]